MTDIPLRTTLRGQLHSLLTAGIAAGRWRDTLPSEARLCRDFRVSRNTLRQVLAQLARDGCLTLGGRGRPHQIRHRTPAPLPPPGRTVRVLTPYAVNAHGSVTSALLSSIAGHLEPAGFHLVIECHPGLYRRYRPSELARLDAQPDTAAWILSFCTPRMQQWFAAHGRPAMTLGQVAAGVPLPSIQMDYQAVGRHAAGLFHARGHRRLVYLIEQATSLGDQAVARSFVAEAARLGAEARVVRYASGPGLFSRCLAGVLAHAPRPTGLFIGSSHMTLTALCHLLGAGLRVPRDFSILCAWDDNTLDFTQPAISRYCYDVRQLSRLTAETVLELARRGVSIQQPTAVLPEFVDRGSLGPCP